MPTPLDDNQRSRFTGEHPHWTLDGKTASRTFGFADFAAAMGFVNRVGLVAERADHHPDIDIRWNRVTLAVSTHSAKAFTERDVDLIETIDGWDR